MGVIRDWRVAAVDREGRAFRRAAAAVDLATEVRSCPDWTMRQLVSHLARVYRGVAMSVARGVVEPPALLPRPPEDGLLEWYDDGLAQLVAALTPATNGPSLPAAATFWPRRMAHESAIHRWDAEQTAYGAAAEFDSALAADGVGEVVEALLGSRATLEPLASARGTVELACTDTGDRWLVRIEPGEVTGELLTGELLTGPLLTGERRDGDGLTNRRVPGRPHRPDARISGPAQELYLLLWGRRRVADLAGVRLAGDRGLARLIRAA